MRVFWAWVEGATGNIALALESVVEQVRSWVSGVGLEGLGLPSSMDTLNTLLVGWMLFVTLILILGSFFYFKFIHQLDNENETMSEDTDPKREPRDKEKSQAEGGSSTREGKAGKIRQPPAEPARIPTIVPRQPPLAVSPPVATGADSDAVAWTTNVFTWLYNSPEGGKVIKKIWLDTVNENTVKTAIDTGILVEVVELLPASPAPTLSNMVVDCSPSDNVTITCDCDATMYLRLVTTRTQGENTTESEYACAVQPLRGRLNIATLTADLMCVVKFDGWPEVLLRLEGIRNNATGLDEQTMQDVIMEVLSSALRNSVLDLNFKPVPTFPRFRRARQEPEPIIPVGYDSMVREMQTHPPSAKASPRPAPTCAPGPAPAPASAHVPAPSVEEVREVAGKAFTALSFAASPGLNSGLTTSEEQLIARNLYKYPSLENTDLEPEEIADLCKTWQENYVPTAKVPTPTATEEEVVPRSDSYQEQKDEAPGQNFVLVASNRSKMIDEPRSVVFVEDTQDVEYELEEEPELALLTTQKPHDEPCIRRQSGSPLLLAVPRVSNDTTVVVNEGKSTQDGPMTLDQIAKSLGVVDGSPGLGSQQNEFPTSSLPTTTTTTTNQPMGIPGLNGKRLLVKIVKATGVGCDKSVSDAYAVVEMDEPPQKFTTSVAKDTNSPFWDEQFLFDLSGGTLELLFELYDRKDGNFLGLGIVGIEELVATPSQRQIIPLQSRPYENDHVSGSLTVEFLFLDRAEVPEHTVRTSATSQSLGPRGALITTTTTTYVKAPEGVDCCGEETTNQTSSPEEPVVNPDIIVNGGDGVAAAALRDIEEKKAIVANNASKSTMIIHASRKAEEEALPEVMAVIATASPTTTTAQTSPQHSTMGTTTRTAIPASTENADTTETNGTEERGRSRGVRRKRDSFFGTLKKRFSRSKIRSKSMEPGRDPSDDLDQSVGRSISMERSTNVSRASGLLSVPPGVGGGGGDGGSTRSSLSDTSAISGSSTRTYVNEASTLIVETTENGVFKHYLIPLSLQQKSKWRKKGTKLHIYGEHTFVAKHMSSSTQCEVCGKNMGRRLGKQGYACRDCGYRCHKPCHVKTDTTCPSSTVNTMDLEYVKDVREERRAWLKKN